ncbi:MAG: DUF885 domain-containing protein [Pseudomonadota bacterium]
MKLYDISEKQKNQARLRRVADLAWEHVGGFPFASSISDRRLTSMPDVSIEGAERRRAIAEEILSETSALDRDHLSHDDLLTVALLNYYAGYWRLARKNYLLDFDVSGTGFSGPFVQTAYTGGFVLNAISAYFKNFAFSGVKQADEYLSLLADLARFLEQIRARTEEQARHGIRIHRPQLPAVRMLLENYRQKAETEYCPAKDRLLHLGQSGWYDTEIKKRVDELVVPAFQSLIDQLDDAYEALAPAGVGIDKFPGGDEVYRDLVRWHTTLDMTPQEIHQAGHDRMARIERQIAEVQTKIGFSGSYDEFREFVKNDKRAVAKDADDIGEKMRMHKGRVEKRFDEFFVDQPASECDVERLDPSLEGAMTWGFYQEPSIDDPRGTYFYNGSRLNSQSVLGAASLTFHELVPGHHLHLSTQFDNEHMHPIRRYAFVNAFNEGWAEYAATLTGEMGLYDDPFDKLGRLIFDAFLTSRLVVDTGLNLLGWTLDDAKTYMREHTFARPEEVESDLLRYSCDIPAQSLAYKLGDEEILRMRADAQDRLGGAYTHKSFHAAVLRPGGLPLPVLEDHLKSVLA